MGQQKQECAVENAELESIEIINRRDAKELNLKYYFTGKPCKHGHVSRRISRNGYCTSCMKIDSKTSNNKKSKERTRIRSAEWREKNKEKELNGYKKYYLKNKEKIKEKKKEYRRKNRNTIKQYRKANREKIKESSRIWRSKNKESVLARNLIHRVLCNWKGTRGDAESILGYTFEQLKIRIESIFMDGMTWENHSQEGWHLDHIKPVNAFIKEGITDPSVISALSNLQPLWAKDNLSKGAKYEDQPTNTSVRRCKF